MTKASTDNLITLRVWIANEHGNELNHTHIQVPAQEVIDGGIEDAEDVEEAHQELIDDYVYSLIKGVDKPRTENRKEERQ